MPDADRPMDMRGAVLPLLNGGTFMTFQTDDDNNAVVNTAVTLKWSLYIPAELLTYLEEAYRAARTITCTYPWRGSTATITGKIIPNGFKIQQRHAKLYGLEIVVQTVSV